jgi:preprotein translocase subunit YajC
MLYAWMLLAQVQEKAEEAGKKAGDAPNPLMQLMPIFLIVIVFYFLIIVPGRKERQQRQAMVSALKKNDRVITSSGIVGVVVNIREGTEEVTIKSDEAKFIILKSSIARILTEPDAAASAPAASATQIKPEP